MQAAAQDLSLPNDFFDRQWAQESGRGQNMRSPAGAQGHFGIMPATQHAWEQRDGASYNPDDFYDGLYMAYRTMGENLDHFKDPVDATRAYNSGWDPSKWNNPETVGYVNALWGDALPSLKRAAAAPTDTLPSLKAGRQAAGKPGTPVYDAIRMQAADGLLQQGDGGIDAARVHGIEAEQASAAEQARKDATGVSDVFQAAERDPRVMPTWTILDKFADGPDTPDPNYDYMARRDKIEAGLTDDEREYLRENAVSDASEQRALAQIAYRRDLDQTYSDAGGFSRFAGTMAAGLTDPASWAAGLVVSKGFQFARIGHAALATEGRIAAALGSLAAENAAANVAVEGISDALGEHKTSADYVSAAASGVLMSGMFARGVFRQAHEAHVRDIATDMQARAADEQAAKVSDVMREDPAATPDQVGERVVQQETADLSRAVDEATGPQRMDPVVPDDVRDEMAREFQGESDDAAPEPVKAAKETNNDFADTVVEPTTWERLDQLRKGEVTRQVRDTTGGTIKLSWSADGNKLPKHGTLAEALTAVHMHPLATPADKRLATYLVKVMSADGLQADIRFTARKGQSNFDPNGPGVAINDHGTGTSGAAGRNSLVAQMQGLTKTGLYAVLHETVHVATYHRINAWEAAAGKLRPEQQRVMSQFQDLFDRYRDEVEPIRAQGRNPNAGSLYAAKNMHEFAAQAMTDRETRFVLSEMPGKPVAGRTSNALREFLSLIKRILGIGDKHTGLDEASKLIDQMIAMPLDNVTFADGKPVFAGETNTNPLISRRARDTWAQRMTQYAADYMARNPINREKLQTLTMKMGGASDGLVLANSKNPIMQLVASLVTETTTGAAGRKANVAIRSHMLARKYVGNALLDFDNAYTVWRNRNGGGVMDDIFRGDKRRQFDKAVYGEVIKRRSVNYQPTGDKAVIEAADALEGLFDRSRVSQIEAGVLGHGNLPTSSRGYIPQALDGVKLQAATVKDLALLHEALASQFEQRLGWDRDFARDFAPFYTERARRRAMGDKGIDGLGAGGEGLQLVRDTLEEMQANPDLVDRARAAMSSMGQSHTRKRLDLDLSQELRPGLRMLDFYNTNPLVLARSYAKRTAGTVALTEAGIHGIRGVRELRQAALFKQDETQPNAQELAAFDRVTAEILGTPVAGHVVSNGASNMALLVGLQRLGGLVFTQAAETFNMIHHLGLRSLLSGVGELPRIMGEVGRLKRGAPSGNHILTSIEQYGGELGTEMFKMVAPLDAPDRMLSEYLDHQPGLLTRALRAGGHLQSKISGFRGLMAAQHRMVAEQIVMRAARFIRDGGESVALRDMGFTPEVAAAMKRDLKEVAKWDANDKLMEFDLTKVSDARTAEAFVQAVHRGTSQIIQGTFVGERNKWFHNDYMKLLMQLRTFGLIATEKQWGRVRMNHGYAYAAGALLANMALTLPIHLARVQLASLGRADRDQFIKDNLAPINVTKALMNYASLSGMASDTLDILTGIAGGYTSGDTKDLLGGRNGTQATSVGKLIPAAASIDNAARAISNHSKLYTTLKQLPFSNLWYLLPAINVTK